MEVVMVGCMHTSVVGNIMVINGVVGCVVKHGGSVVRGAWAIGAA